MGSGPEKNLGSQLVWYVTDGKHGHDFGIGRDGKVAGNTANQKQLLAACELWGSNDPTRMLRYSKTEEKGFMFTEPFSATYWGIWAFAKAAAWLWVDKNIGTRNSTAVKRGDLVKGYSRWFATSRALATLHLVGDPNKIRPVAPSAEDPYRHVVFAMPGARCKRVASNAWRSLHSLMPVKFIRSGWKNADVRALMTLSMLGDGFPTWLYDLPTDQEAIDYLQKNLVIFGNWPLFGPVSLHWERYADGGFCSWMPKVPSYDTPQCGVSYHSNGTIKILRSKWHTVYADDFVVLNDADKKTGIFRTTAIDEPSGRLLTTEASYHGSREKNGNPAKVKYEEWYIRLVQKPILSATFGPDKPTLSKPEPLYSEMPHLGEPVEGPHDENGNGVDDSLFDVFDQCRIATLNEVIKWADDRIAALAKEKGGAG